MLLKGLLKRVVKGTVSVISNDLQQVAHDQVFIRYQCFCFFKLYIFFYCFSAKVTCRICCFKEVNGEIHRNEHFLNQKNDFIFPIFDKIRVSWEMGTFINPALTSLHGGFT